MSARDDLKNALLEFNNAGGSVVVLVDSIIEAVKEEIHNERPQGDISEALKAALKPELIQGYTAEQWQEIIDGGYLCEFRNGDAKWKQAKMELKELKKGVSVPFVSLKGNDYSDCRPAQIKGVMKPIWVEPVDIKIMICLFDKEGFPLNGKGHRMSYERYAADLEDNSTYKEATSYIEL